jgi:ankyrin repeat protein
MRRTLLIVALFAGNSLIGTSPAAAGEPLRLAQIAPSETELRIYAGLHAAAAEGDAAEIVRLIAAGERPNLQDSRSRTPLHVAAFFGRHEAARSLIRLGANVNARERQRFDALTIAAVNGDSEMVDILLAAGADPRASSAPMTARR